jgi:hypothetical protein
LRNFVRKGNARDFPGWGTDSSHKAIWQNKSKFIQVLVLGRFGTLKNLTLSLIILEHSFSFEKCSQIGVSMFPASLVNSGQRSDFLVLSELSIQLEMKIKAKRHDLE